MNTRAKRRLAAILSADVVGYSRMMGLDEAGTLDRLNRLRREVIHPLMEEYGGRVVKTTGDGTLAEFASAVDAVSQAIEVQRRIAEWSEALPEAQRLAFRIGVNVGDIIVEDGDIFGDGVNIAARLEGLAAPGGLCISETTHAHVKGKVGVDFADLGPQEVKNIVEPVQVWAWASDGRVARRAEARRSTVAVMPFANLSADPEQEFFADGLVEDISAALSRFPQLHVTARNSAFAYKGRAVDAREVGAALGARFVLEGSVRRAGRRIRIGCQLIDATSGAQVWAARHDGEMEDVFDLQDKITSAVATAIEPAIHRADLEATKRKPPENRDVYELYLTALSAIFGLGEEEVARSHDLIERAVALEPDFIPALGLSVWHLEWRLVRTRSNDDERLRSICLERTRRILTAPEEDAGALAMAALALVSVQKDAASALETVDRALRANPNSEIARNIGALVCAFAGDAERSMALSEAISADGGSDARTRPQLSARILSLLLLGENQKALDQALSAVKVNISRREPLRWWVCLAATRLGRRDLAKQAVDELKAIFPHASGAFYRERLPFADPALRAELVDALIAAGLPE